MDISEILTYCDHTLLSPAATWDEICDVLKDALHFKTASACIPPSFVARAKEAFKDLNICTVIGFPNGYNSTETKVYETVCALKDGADEIDMVINIGALKEKNYQYVETEIAKIKAVCGEKILKVIIETCLLTDDEKIAMCEIVSRAGADFIKTSTGFSKGGATKADIELFAKHIAPHVKMKAAGGISSLADAEDFIKLGCARLGTSRIVALAKALDGGNTDY